MGMEFESRRPLVTKEDIKRAQEEAKRLSEELKASENKEAKGE